MIAWTSPLFTVRSRPLRICLPSTVTCKFLTSSIGTSCSFSFSSPSPRKRGEVKNLQAEMRDDLGNQLLFSHFLVFDIDQTERASAHIDLALLADHDHHSFRVY